MKQAPEQLRFAVVAVDIPVFAFFDGALHALVSEVNRPPHYVGMQGFLGGIILPEENTEEAVHRILNEKGGLRKIYTEQLYTFSDVERDKRNRVVSVSYMALISPSVAEIYKFEGAKFVPVKDLGVLAYDHNKMLQVAVSRLQGKLSYTTIAQHLLPTHFTLSELQLVYETVLQKEFDKRNFRKKILSLDIVKDTGKLQEGVPNRPASLYEFSSKEVTDLQLF